MCSLDLLDRLDRMELQSAVAGSERRSHQRLTIRAEGELQPMERSAADRMPIAIALRDISRTGVGFVLPQVVPVDSLWHLSFFYQGHEVSRLGLIVRHCRHVGERIYLAGGAFCVDTATLQLLGLTPLAIRQADRTHFGQEDGDEPGADQFLPPEQV